MIYPLTEEQQTIQKLAANVASASIRPNALQLDETQEFPYFLFQALAETGLGGVYIDEQYGGIGGGTMELALVIEQLSMECAGIALSFAGTSLSTYPILLFGTDEQKKKYLPNVAGGKWIGAFALTEEGAGSDVASIKTQATLDGGCYCISGSKQWISNGGVADFYVVMVSTNQERGARGLTAFLVDKDTEGLKSGKKENKMGIRASSTTQLFFDQCRIPVRSRLGREGEGFKIAMTTLDHSRPGVAAQALGIAQGAYKAAKEHVKNRVQFGQPVSAFQAVQHTLADMATQIEAARALLYQTCQFIDSKPKRFSSEAAMVKVFASDMAMKVTTDAVQLMGGYGYMKDYPVEKRMRDAKITQIYEGTNQVLRNIIGLSITSAK